MPTLTRAVRVVCCDAGDGLVDVVSVDAPGGGGKVVASSSAHYSVPSNMLKAPRALNMGDGWETARMRGQPDYGVFHLEGPVLSDYNWTLFKLSQECVIKKIGVDTLHFKHNNPIAFSLEGCYEPGLIKDNYHSRGIKYTQCTTVCACVRACMCVCVRCVRCGV
jgi:allantoicase